MVPTTRNTTSYDCVVSLIIAETLAKNVSSLLQINNSRAELHDPNHQKQDLGGLFDVLHLS